MLMIETKKNKTKQNRTKRKLGKEKRVVLIEQIGRDREENKQNTQKISLPPIFPEM